MSGNGRRRKDERIGSLVLLAAFLFTASADQTLSAASKRPRSNPPVTASVAPPAQIPPAAAPPAAPAPPGYWLAGSDGGVYGYGSLPFKGSAGGLTLNRPIVGMAATPNGQGYWLVASDGGIFSFGDAVFRGSTGAVRLNRPIVGMAATPSGQGYWLVASDGGIFSFGDAVFRGSTGAVRLNRPIVGMAATPSGQGYWLVASDGGIFSFGDAMFRGSTGAVKLVRPITGMAATPGGRGYWLTASDGGLFSFGDARFFGAASERVALDSGRGVVGIVPTTSGAGYWQVAATGAVFNFGDAPALGAPEQVRAGIIGMAARLGLPAPTPVAVKPAESFVATGPAPQFFASTSKPTWGTSPSEAEKDKAGRALAVAEAGSKVFIGGEFTGMVPPSFTRKTAAEAPVTPRAFLAALDVNSGALIDWDVRPDDAVLSMAVSPDRRTLYVGGRFSQIAGAPAGRIAAIDIESRRLVPGFRPPIADGAVKAMALHGNTLYVGGDFEALDGVARSQLAAIDATTGALRDGFVPPRNGGGYYQGHTGRESTSGDNNGATHDIGVTADGRYLVVGGDFVDFGGQGGLLVVDAASGAATRWQPDIDRPVFGVAMWPGDNRTFFVATGGSGGTVQAFRIADSPPTPSDDSERRRFRRSSHRDEDRNGEDEDRSGEDESRNGEPLWIHRTDGDATGVAATTERVYLVGHYDYVLGDNTTCRGSSCAGGRPGDVSNRHLSAFEPKAGAHDVGFTAALNTPQGPYAVSIGAGSLYVVGDFTEANQAPQPGFVQFPAIS